MVLKKNPIIGALCIIVCLFATPRSLAADTLLHDDEIVSPCMEYISNTVCKIGISNGVATSTAIVSGNPLLTTKCQIILKLQQKTGSSWKTIQIWTDSKTGSYMTLSKTKTVTKGKTYRATATFTVWSGTKTESKTVYSAAKTA